MKYVSAILLVTILWSPIKSIAQSNSLEVFYGINFSRNTDSFRSRDAQTFGLTYHHTLNELVRYNFELSHRIRGAQTRRDFKNLKFIIHRSVFEIKYPFFPTNKTFLLLGGGGYIGYKYEQNLVNESRSGIREVSELNENYKNIDFGFALNYGVGFVITEMIHLHLRGHIDLGFRDLYQPSSVAEPFKIRDFGLLLGSEFLF